MFRLFTTTYVKGLVSTNVGHWKKLSAENDTKAANSRFVGYNNISIWYLFLSKNG